MTKKSSDASSNRARMRFEPSSSDGFGGVRPAGSSVRFGIPVAARASSGCTSPASTSDRPTSPATWKRSCCRGRRRSASTTSTRSPARARARARFEAMVDLPSEGSALVNETTRGGSSTETNLRLVRSARMASPARGSRSTASSPVRVRDAFSGTAPITPAPVISFTSARLRTFTSRRRRSTAMASPAPSPATAPRRMLRRVSGLTGAEGTRASDSGTTSSGLFLSTSAATSAVACSALFASCAAVSGSVEVAVTLIMLDPGTSAAESESSSSCPVSCATRSRTAWLLIRAT